MSNRISLTNSNGLFISMIGATGQGADRSYSVVYDVSTQKVTYNSAKTFVIDHPDDSNKFLVHACLEGPEAGVYYRGKASIENGEYVTIALPAYVDKLAKNFTVHLTQIYDANKKDEHFVLKSTEVENNRFSVYGLNCKFFWIVYGERHSIEVEPEKSAVSVEGSGPYRWVK